MTEVDPKKNVAQQPMSEKASQGDYSVGKGRPPVETRWKPGQSGNPGGRRKGRRNVKTELRGIAFKKIAVRDGKGERELTLLGANILAHGIKGAKGDVRSAGLFLTHAHRLGLLDDEVAAVLESAARDSRDGGAVLITPASKSRPSDTLFENLDLQLLDREEQKQIVNRDRGKNITL